MNEIDKNELRELFIEIKQDNKIAYEKLYSKYKKLVYGIAFSILKNQNDSEDVVQIVFEKLYTIDKEKLPSSKEASWLYSLTKNETITFLRKKGKTTDLDSIYEINDNNSEINNVIDRLEFNKLISGLNDKEKQIISLKILANFSFKEISQILNEPTGTVKWRYYKSIHTLKLLLSNLGMCIITFVIGIKTLFKHSIQKTADSSEAIDESIENDISQSENAETENNEDLKDTEVGQETSDYADQNIIEQEEIIEEIQVGNNQGTNINSYGIGILSISAIFLILTIIFSVFLIKRQLNRQNKTSK